jgi:hypothetical protein
MALNTLRLLPCHPRTAIHHTARPHPKKTNHVSDRKGKNRRPIQSDCAAGISQHLTRRNANPHPRKPDYLKRSRGKNRKAGGANPKNHTPV